MKIKEFISGFNLEIVVPILIAIFGWWYNSKQSNKTLRNTNKNALLDRQIHVFKLAEQFFDSLENQSKIMEPISGKEEDLFQRGSLFFEAMCENLALHEQIELFPEVLNRRGRRSRENQEQFAVYELKKRELDEVALDAELVFDSPINTVVKDFITSYVKLLDEFRSYEDTLRLATIEQDKYPYQKNIPFTEFVKSFGEYDIRQEKLIPTQKQLINSFEDYKKIRNKIKDQLSLSNQ